MQIIENPEIEKEITLKEGDIIKQVHNSKYWVVVNEPKGYILREVCGAAGWTGYHLTIKDLEDSINFHLKEGIKVFSKDEYELVLTRKKKEM